MFNVYDGVLGALAFNDERPVALWSHYQADALVARIAEYKNRARVAEWTVADNAQRLGALTETATPSVRARLEACVAQAEAHRESVYRTLARLRAQARVMEAARQADSYAPRVSPFEPDAQD
jgi:hypothetical protein